MSNGIAIFMSIAIAIYGNEGKDDDIGECRGIVELSEKRLGIKLRHRLLG